MAASMLAAVEGVVAELAARAGAVEMEEGLEKAGVLVGVGSVEGAGLPAQLGLAA